MNQVKIVHLSDLHCVDTKEWDSNLDHLKNGIIELDPDIIVVTGDFVDKPNENLYKKYATAKQDIISSLLSGGARKKYFFLTVPGNHDYYPKGLRLTGKSTLFRKYFSKLQYPEKDTFKELGKEILENYKIALYPIDSNDGGYSTVMAQGRVNDPEKVLKEYRNEYALLADSMGIALDSCIKIAALHHHPLPLPATRNDELREGMMILKNAHQLLGGAEKYGIDLILHGHRHEPGNSEYRSISNKHKPLVVSACGTSGMVGAGRREFKLLEVYKEGAVTIKTYMSDEKNMVFEDTMPDKSNFLIEYSQIRKRRNELSELYLNENEGGLKKSCVEKIKNKTKLVKITGDGNAVITIYQEKIKWNEDAIREDAPPVIYEPIRADIGRVSYGWKALIDKKRPELDELVYSRNPEEGGTQSPDIPEAFTMPIHPVRQISGKHEAYCHLKYHLFNGYMLTKEDHEEAYVHEDITLREETTSICANYPTELLELIVRFPLKKYFPDETDFSLDVSLRLKEEEERTLVVQERKYSIDSLEKDFLDEKIAIRYRKELQEVGVVIRHPQPGRLYTLRWKLPVSHDEAKLTNMQAETARNLRKCLLDTDSKEVKQFYEGIAQEFKSFTDMNEVDIWLFGYDDENKRLRISCGPNNRMILSREVCIGRGVVGKAFRVRGIWYWSKRHSMDPEDEYVFQEPEKMVDSYDISAALALPLMYPRIHREQWEEMVKKQEDGRCPVFGVISITSKSHTQLFSDFEPSKDSGASADNDEKIKRRNEFLEGLYGVIWKQLESNFGSYLSI